MLTTPGPVLGLVRSAEWRSSCSVQPPRGLRQEIIDLCSGLSPAPEVSFSGPVDGALHPAARTHIIMMLPDALPVISQHAAPGSVEVVAGDRECLAVIKATPPGNVDPGTAPADLAALREQAASGARIDIEAAPADGTRGARHIPLTATQAAAQLA